MNISKPFDWFWRRSSWSRVGACTAVGSVPVSAAGGAVLWVPHDQLLQGLIYAGYGLAGLASFTFAGFVIFFVGGLITENVDA
jgi:hypothetical protein